MLAEAGPRFGFKLRTGGVTIDDYPASALVVKTIDACLRADVAWKATAGLHRSLRHYNEALQVWSHGFLNLFAAAVFAEAHHLDGETLQRIFKEQSPDKFIFESEAIVWNDLRVTIEQIELARKSGLRSFGSCSFDQPQNDLQVFCSTVSA